jgi:hypothetical protein
MWKLVLTATILLMAPVVVNAQNYGGTTAPVRGHPLPRHLLNRDYPTSNGETVPPAAARQHAQRPDSHIQHSICSNC